MLALPLQALASAAMLGCSFAHPAPVAQLAPADAAMATPCHEPERNAAPATYSDCSHCASCALASALPIPATDVPAVVPAARHYSALLTPRFSGFVPDGPERPPRPGFA